MDTKTKAIIGGGALLGLGALAYLLWPRGEGGGGGGGGTEVSGGGLADILGGGKKTGGDQTDGGGGAGPGPGVLDLSQVPYGMGDLFTSLSTQLRTAPQEFTDITAAFPNLTPFMTAREATLGTYMAEGGLFVAPTGTEGVASYGTFTNTKKGALQAIPTGYSGEFAFCQGESCGLGKGAAGNVAGTPQAFNYLGTGTLLDVSNVAAVLNPDKLLSMGKKTVAVQTAGETSQGIVRTSAGAFYTTGKKAGTAFTCSKWEGLEYGGTPHRVQVPC